MNYYTHYHYKVQVHLTDKNQTILLRYLDEENGESHTFPIPVKDAAELFRSISDDIKKLTEGAV